jgi:hypothetical protein
MGRTKRDGKLLGRMLAMLGGDTCLNKSLNKNSKFWLKAKRKYKRKLFVKTLKRILKTS